TTQSHTPASLPPPTAVNASVAPFPVYAPAAPYPPAPVASSYPLYATAPTPVYAPPAPVPMQWAPTHQRPQPINASTNGPNASARPTRLALDQGTPMDIVKDEDEDETASMDIDEGDDDNDGPPIYSDPNGDVRMVWLENDGDVIMQEW